MIKIHVSMLILVLFISLSCQIINVPEKSLRKSAETKETATSKINDTPKPKENAPKNKEPENIQPVTNILINAPIDEFNEIATNNFLRDFPFTNFETQNYNNPIYTAIIFLKSLKDKNLKLLLESSNSNSPLLGINIPKDSEIWWQYFAGSISSVKGIRAIFQAAKNTDELYFRLSPGAANQADCILVLKKTNENDNSYWKLWNYLHDVKIDYVDALNNFGLRADMVIWQGFWQPIAFEEPNIKPNIDKNPGRNSLDKIFTALKSSDLNIDAYFLSKQLLQTNVPELLHSDFAINTDKRNQDKMLLNFYSTEQIKSYQTVLSYFVSPNLQIETAIVIFDSKVNKILYLRWFIFNETPCLEDADILSPEKHHIILSIK